MTTGRYLAIDDLILLHGEGYLLQLAGLGGFNNPNGRTLDRARLQAQIDRAQSLIDSYVLKQFPELAGLASDVMPPSLQGAAADLVIYWLRGRVGDKGDVDDVARGRYKDVMDWLRSIRDGGVDLGLTPSTVRSEGSSSDGFHGAFPEPRAPSVLEGY